MFRTATARRPLAAATAAAASFAILAGIGAGPASAADLRTAPPGEPTALQIKMSEILVSSITAGSTRPAITKTGTGTLILSGN